jgi:hypothetical protein
VKTEVIYIALAAFIFISTYLLSSYSLINQTLGFITYLPLLFLLLTFLVLTYLSVSVIIPLSLLPSIMILSAPPIFTDLFRISYAVVAIMGIIGGTIVNLFRGGRVESFDFKFKIKRVEVTDFLVIAFSFGVAITSSLLISSDIYYLIGVDLSSFLSIICSLKEDKLYLKVLPLISITSWFSNPIILLRLRKGEVEFKKGVRLGEIFASLERNPEKEAYYISKNTRRDKWRWVRSNGELKVDFLGEGHLNIVVLGSSGSGKSTLTSLIANSLNIKKIIIDYHGEYKALIKGQFKIVDGVENSINVLDLLYSSPKKRALEISYIMKSLFRLGNLQTMTLSNLIVETYEHKGIYEDDESSWSIDPPIMQDLLRITELKLRLNPGDNLLSSIYPYIKYLSSSVLSEKSVNLSDVLESNTILDLSKLPTDEIKYFYADTILRAILYLAYRKGKRGLEKVLIIDEAHRIADKESGEEILTRLSAEGRKFGIGLIVSSQRPQNLKGVIANSSFVFTLHLSEPSDIDYTSRLISAFDEDNRVDEIKKGVGSLARGEAIVKYKGEGVFLMKIDKPI